MGSLIAVKVILGKDPPIIRINDIEQFRPKPEKNTLLIVGDATGVFDDLEAFYGFGIDHDTMLLNYMPTIFKGKYEHYAAGDAHMEDMQAVARDHIPEHVVKHCWNPNSKGFSVRWLKNGSKGWTGTTGSLAIRVGLILDYTRIVLAGMPMDNSGNWYCPYIPEDDVKQNKDHTAHLWKWSEFACRPIARFLRSMSGNTKGLFGYPTIEWLNFQQEITL